MLFVGAGVLFIVNHWKMEIIEKYKKLSSIILRVSRTPSTMGSRKTQFKLLKLRGDLLKQQSLVSFRRPLIWHWRKLSEPVSVWPSAVPSSVRPAPCSVGYLSGPPCGCTQLAYHHSPAVPNLVGKGRRCNPDSWPKASHWTGFPWASPWIPHRFRVLTDLGDSGWRPPPGRQGLQGVESSIQAWGVELMCEGEGMGGDKNHQCLLVKRCHRKTTTGTTLLQAYTDTHTYEKNQSIYKLISRDQKQNVKFCVILFICNFYKLNWKEQGAWGCRREDDGNTLSSLWWCWQSFVKTHGTILSKYRQPRTTRPFYDRVRELGETLVQHGILGRVFTLIWFQN